MFVCVCCAPHILHFKYSNMYKLIERFEGRTQIIYILSMYFRFVSIHLDLYVCDRYLPWIWCSSRCIAIHCLLDAILRFPIIFRSKQLNTVNIHFSTTKQKTKKKASGSSKDAATIKVVATT